MAEDVATVELSLAELRAVAGYAAACARPALVIFESVRPDDDGPRTAIDAALQFAPGAPRSRMLRDTAWAAQRAASQPSWWRSCGATPNAPRRGGRVGELVRQLDAALR